MTQRRTGEGTIGEGSNSHLLELSVSWVVVALDGRWWCEGIDRVDDGLEQEASWVVDIVATF